MDERRREEESSLRGYEHEFERAAEELRAAVASKRAFVSDAQKIKLYSLFKQATEGDCAKPQPSAFQPVERAKWNGWQSLQGMAVTVAKRRYVLQVIELVPSFKMPTEAQQQPQQIEEVNAATSASSASDAEPVAPVQSAAQGPIPPSPPLQQPAVSAPSTQQRRPRPSTRPRQLQQQSLRLPPRQRLKQPVAASSYGAIVLQVLLFAALIGGFLFVSTRVALPLSLDLIAQHFGDESSRALVKSLTPMFWFALGYLFVAAIRSRIFSWRLLSGEFVWLNLASPRAHFRPRVASRQQQRRRRRQAGSRESEPPKSPTTLLLKKLDIQLVEEASENDSNSNLIVPRLELALAENPDAMRFGDSLTVFPFRLEQTADVYYRKFKEPLPDLASPSPSLLAITVLEEHEFPEFGAVFRRRKLQFRNNAPYLIKRQFASSDFVEYVEDSLLDKRNRIFYVYTKNESFQSFGTIEDFAVYHVSEDNLQWTELSQGARFHITNSSIGFLRSKIESLASSSYAKNIPQTRQYHQQRLVEEFGEPAGLPATHAPEEVNAEE
ncbi:hypothetical protein Gpo141_00004349 [Globisporangium polare]